MLSLMTSTEEKGEAALDGEKWWEQVEDWDSFTADANNILKMLILEEMTKNLAAAIGTDEDNINIKATTTEGMGFEGREEGISAYAVVLLKNQLN